MFCSVCVCVCFFFWCVLCVLCVFVVVVVVVVVFGLLVVIWLNMALLVFTVFCSISISWCFVRCFKELLEMQKEKFG